MLLFSDFGPKKDFRVTVPLKTVTPHLRSIVPNVQRHMAYFFKMVGTSFFFSVEFFSE
jgi:hypothetical protein